MKNQFFKKVQCLSFLLCFISVGLGQLQAQQLYYQSSSEKMPLKVDKSSAIIQFKPNTNVQSALISIKSSQSLKEVKAHPTKKRAILDFNENQNLTLIQLKENYFRNNNQVESISYAYQLESGMQLWPTNHVVLKLKTGASLNSLASLMDRYQATYLKTNHEMVILKIADIQDALLLSNLINDSGYVEWANPDFFVEIVHADTPKTVSNEDNLVTDPLFPEQFQMHNTGQTIDGTPGLNDADCNALEAWEITTGSADIIVAVIDDGVEAHEDLGNVLPGYTPAIPGEIGQPGNNPDDNEHGQACSGIIAASHNGIGVMGVAPNVNILPINIFTREETFTDLANAFYWAADNGADIISNSWGFTNSCGLSDPSIDAGIAYAVANGRGGKGSIVIFASGNQFQNCVDYPASNPNVIAVGAFDNTGIISSYSNEGPALDITAPSSGNGAARVRTTDRMGAAGYSAGNYTNTFGGTSAACPVVSGVAALVLSVNPNLTDAEVKNILYTTAIDMGAAGRDNTFGHGRANALGAVNAALPPCDIVLNSVDLTSKSCVDIDDGVITINATSTNTIEYSIDNGVTFESTNSFTNLAEGEYIVVVQDQGDPTCTATTTVIINVGPDKVDPTFDAVDPICSGDVLADLPLTSTNGITGTWNPATVDNTTTTEYTFTPADGQCANTATLTITVNPLPIPVISGPTDYCEGSGGVTLDAGAGFGSYLWSPGNETTQTITAMVGTYTVTVTDAVSGCSATSSEYIVVENALPTVTFTAPADLAIDAGVQTSLGGGTPAGGVYSGPGVTDDGNGQTYSFDPAVAGLGIQTITYTFSDTLGCTGEASDDVEVTAIVEVCSVAVQSTTVNGQGFVRACEGNTDSFLLETTVTGNGTLSYQWQILDLENFSWQNITGATSSSFTLNDINVVGNYNYRIVARSDNGTPNNFSDDCTAVSGVAATISVSEPPTVTFMAPADLAIDAGVQTGLGGGTPAGGVYSGPGVTDDGNGQSYSFDPAAAGLGIQTLTYTFTDTNGCTGEASDDVEVTAVVDICTVSIETQPESVDLCVDDPTSFSVVASGTGLICSNWQISDNNGATFEDLFDIACGSSSISFISLPLTANNAQIRVVVTSDNGTPNDTNDDCSVTSDVAIISVSPKTDPTFDPVVVCADDILEPLPTTSNNGITGIWTPALDIGITNYLFTPNDGQCANTTSLTITVNPLPTVTFTAPADLAIDAGVQTGLGGGTPAGGVYSGPGVTDDGNGQTYSFDPAQAGIGVQSITYTVTNTTGCTASASSTLEVISGCIAPEIIEVTAVPGNCPGDNATITVNGTLNGAKEWVLYTDECEGVQVATSTDGIFEVQVNTATTYYVRAEGGCIDTSGSTGLVWEEQFDGGIPNTWTLDSSPTGADWAWSSDGTIDDVFINGSTYVASFIGPFDSIESPSVANGAAQFNADAYSTNGTFNPGSGPFPGVKNSTMTSPSIDCSGKSNISLQFNQYYRPFINIVTTIGVSNDGGSTWTDFIINTDIGINVLTPKDDVQTIDITAIAANQSNVKVRFNWTGDVAYFWIIDDIQLLTEDIGVDTSCVSVLVEPTPEVVVNFTAPEDLCLDAGVQTGLGGATPTGGVYSGPGVTDDGNGQTYTFDPAVAGLGVQVIIYEVINSNNCSASASDQVEVFGLPTVTFTAPADLAIDAGVQTGLGGGTPAGGVYSGSGVTDDGNGQTYSFDPAAAGVGTQTITYTFTDNGCTGEASDDVEVTDTTVTDLPWIEDFEDLAEGTTVDTGDTAWSTSIDQGVWDVRDGLLLLSSVDGGSEAVWTSETISISGHENVTISIDVDDKDRKKERNDYVKVYYKIDDGALIPFGTVTGNTDLRTFSVSGISGSILEIIVATKVSASDETYSIDNINVSETIETPLPTLPWIEDFEDLADGTTADDGATAWSTSIDRGVWGVSDGFLLLSPGDRGSEAVWSSERISIVGNENVTISIDVDDRDNRKESSDYVKVYYRIDDGSLVPFGTVTGNTDLTTFTVSGITGGVLEIVAETRVSWADERYTIDNINVSEIIEQPLPTLPWIEDFEDLADGTTIDNGATAWSTTIDRGVWDVQDGLLLLSPVDRGSEGVWTSERISIVGHENVSISIDVDDRDDSKENNDYVKVYYKLDDGALIPFGTVTGNTDLTTFTMSGITGTVLEIIVETKVSWSNEKYTIDNVNVSSVVAQKELPSISNNNLQDTLKEAYSIFPNPVSDVLNIRTSQSKEIDFIQIYDITGRLVRNYNKNQFNTATTNIRIILDGLQTGAYSVHIVDAENNRIVKKVLVKLK